MKKFEVGKNYFARFINDANTVAKFKVMKRSAKMVTIQGEDGEISRRKARDVDGIERLNPFGKYSMSPVLRADSEEVTKQCQDVFADTLVRVLIKTGQASVDLHSLDLIDICREKTVPEILKAADAYGLAVEQVTPGYVYRFTLMEKS